jgi:hypothetical protein
LLPTQEHALASEQHICKLLGQRPPLKLRPPIVVNQWPVEYLPQPKAGNNQWTFSSFFLDLTDFMEQGTIWFVEQIECSKFFP